MVHRVEFQEPEAGVLFNECISFTVLQYVFVIYVGHRGSRLSPEFSLHCIALHTVCRSDLLGFTLRLHVMQRTVLLSEFCPSVRPSVRQMRVL